MGLHSSVPRYLKHASRQARVIINGRTIWAGASRDSTSNQIVPRRRVVHLW